MALDISVATLNIHNGLEARRSGPDWTGHTLCNDTTDCLTTDRAEVVTYCHVSRGHACPRTRFTRDSVTEHDSSSDPRPAIRPAVSRWGFSGQDTGTHYAHAEGKLCYGMWNMEAHVSSDSSLIKWQIQILHALYHNWDIHALHCQQWTSLQGERKMIKDKWYKEI